MNQELNLSQMWLLTICQNHDATTHEQRFATSQWLFLF